MSTTFRRTRRLAAALGLVALLGLAAALAACGSGAPAAPGSRANSASGGPAPRLGFLEQRVLLLVMAERRIYDPYSVREALKGDAALREELAWTLGRVGSSEGRGVLEELLIDEAAAVQRAAAFALGQLEAGGSEPALLSAAVGWDREAAVHAVGALAAHGAELIEVLSALTPLDEDERWARLLPSLHRFDSEARTVLAARGLEVADPELRRYAAYALTREPAAESLALTRGLLADSDPAVRAWAAAAIGRAGEAADLALLLPLLQDETGLPVVAALRAAIRLIAEGKAAAPATWRAALLRLCDDRRAGVRVTALEAAGAWLLDDEIGGLLVDRVRHGQARGERIAALAALARADHPRAVELAREVAASSEPLLRAAAARAAGLLGEGRLLTALTADEAAGVRAAAYRASLEAYDRSSNGDDDRALVAFVRLALDDPAPAVRGETFAWLAGRPLLGFRELAAAVEQARADREVDTRLAAVGALVARGLGEPLERGGVIAELERLAAAADYPLRRAAIDGLTRFGQPRLPVGSTGPGRGATIYRDLLLRGVGGQMVELQTERGKVRVRLRCEHALLTCLSFVQLARQGFYDGQLFHRVEPAFMVQSGDPGASGWGGPGYTLRDEISPTPFRRGVLAMAHSGPDSAGSQFFLTLSRQPQLDGRYAAFGEVVDGFAVLEAIFEGDRLDRAVVFE